MKMAPEVDQGFGLDSAFNKFCIMFDFVVTPLENRPSGGFEYCLFKIKDGTKKSKLDGTKIRQKFTEC